MGVSTGEIAGLVNAKLKPARADLIISALNAQLGLRMRLGTKQSCVFVAVLEYAGYLVPRLTSFCLLCRSTQPGRAE